MIWRRLCLCMDGGGSAHGVEAVDRGVRDATAERENLLSKKPRVKRWCRREG